MTNTHGANLILVDSDAIIGLVSSLDNNHKKCIQISSYLAKNSMRTVIPYPIVLEAATALSRDTKINRPDLARKILNVYFEENDNAKINFNVAKLVGESFGRNTSRKNTPFDHYLCALAKKNGIRYVFSFDSFYEKQGLILAENLLKQ